MLRALDTAFEAPARTPLPEDAMEGKKFAIKDAKARSRVDPEGASESTARQEKKRAMRVDSIPWLN